MKVLKLILDDERIIEAETGETLWDIILKNDLNNDNKAVLASINGKILELSSLLKEEGKFKIIKLNNSITQRAYVRTLQFILIKAVKDIFPEAVITLEHSLNKGLFGEIHKDSPLTPEDINLIKEQMKEIIKSDYPIKKEAVFKRKAVKIFTEYKMEDKLRLLNTIKPNRLKLYNLDGLYDYFYGAMAYSTGIINLFDLIYYNPGFILIFPHAEDMNSLPVRNDDKKLAEVFYEAEQWGNILGVPDVGSLNQKVLNKEIIDIIRVSEALHEKKIANIADRICERKEVKIVLIAGPSSSGKTTFSKRLGIQLRVNGLIPYTISLDDYFLNREFTPKDENGEFDFESIEALDIKLFNQNLQDILKGEDVNIPIFNFRTGKREWGENRIKLPENGILIIEGIHGLNERLTSTISYKFKFKVYISALTQLNLDNHNRIATTDVRMVRRIVRDSLSRGYGAEDTLKMWSSIKKGEKKNIFVYQEEADAMFNSTLIYELCILKKYALKELLKINPDSPVFYEAKRLISFLNFFISIDKEIVPENSILREFIGGSCFYKY
jgi:uridine kinase